jgi:desulfoferrodoxin (superoxide reductase-like protein)
MTVTRTTEEPFAPGVTVVRESETKFAKNEPTIITSYKELVVKIQSVEILRENERFIEWIKIVRQILEKLYPDFVWPTE